MVETSRYLRSPLKWAGGKYALLGRILPLLPAGHRLIEPFMGSAVVYLNAGDRPALLADLNPRLVSFHRTVRDRPEALLAEARELFHGGNNRESFDTRKAEFNTSPEPVRDAALLLYLNRHGFNGLYRVNSKGLYNVPFGRFASPTLPEESLRALSRRLASAELRLCDFEATLAEAGTGDVVYCDPVYVALSVSSAFGAYTSALFRMSDQERLAYFAERASERGATVIISNHDLEVTRRLYAGASVESFGVQRHISRDVDNREVVKELLAVYAPKAPAATLVVP